MGLIGLRDCIVIGHRVLAFSFRSPQFVGTVLRFFSFLLWLLLFFLRWHCGSCRLPVVQHWLFIHVSILLVLRPRLTLSLGSSWSRWKIRDMAVGTFAGYWKLSGWVIESTDLLNQSANEELDISIAYIFTENIPVLYIHNSVFQSALTQSLLQTDTLVFVRTPAVCTISYQKS